MLMHGVRLLLVCSDQTHAVLLLGARYAPPLLLLLKLHAYWDIAPRVCIQCGFAFKELLE